MRHPAVTPKTLTPADVNALLEAARPGATVFLVAAGGCGMSGLGHLLLDLGFAVHGSDLVENPETVELRKRGATIHCGHDAANMHAAGAFLVIYSSAIKAGNVEMQAAVELGIPIARRATALAAIASRRRSICVAGMHGKTTTSALLSFALEQLGAAPGYAIGSRVPQLVPHARFAPGGWFVAEVDESDGTLPEFHPACSVILNIDEEHLDYFANVQNICREFGQFVQQNSGPVIYCADDPLLSSLMQGHAGAISFGFHRGAAYRVERTGSRFKVWRGSVLLGEFETRLSGEKNVSNAAAVIALLHELKFPADRIATAIGGFTGAARRQQVVFASPDLRVVDDYAHHPNEIRATLAALREIAPGRLVVVFQPHRYTRTLRLMDQFARAFELADRLFLCDVYAASEAEIAGANSGILSDKISSHGTSIRYVPALDDIPTAVESELRSGDTVVFMGAGSITSCAHSFAAKLVERMDNSVSTPGSAADRLRLAVSDATVIHADEPLARRTTLRVGGRADFFIEPGSEADLAAILRVCKEARLPFTIIGRGSNLLVRDGGIRGVVLCLSNDVFSHVSIEASMLRCGAGAKLKTISVEARRVGLAGLEFLEGIPGSVGGGLRMNAGAMGSWMFEVVESVRFMDFSGNVSERKASEVNVEYRGCPLFKTHIALGAVLRGTPAEKELIQSRANDFNAKRWESQPPQPSAGCIFKNPTTVPAGRLIEELGLKGARHGGAMISTVHGNFIVNDGNATAADVLFLIDLVKKTALERRNIQLETEVQILGE